MFDRSVGKKPVPTIASSRTSTGGSTGVKPFAASWSSANAVEREREQRRVADEVAEARAGQPRGALHLEAADLGVLARLGQRGGSPTRRISTASPRCRRRARTRAAGSAPREQLVALRLGRRELLLGRASSSFTRCSSSSCSGVGLPFSFVRPRSSSTRGTSARQRSSAASSASNASAAPLRASAARQRVGVVARGPEVDHAAESRKRLEHLRDALLGRAGADPVGARLQPLVRVLDRDPVARPLEQLDVVLAVAERDRLPRREAEVLREEREPAALRDAGLASSRKYGSDFVMKSRSPKRCDEASAGARRARSGRRRRRASSAAARARRAGRRPA